MAKIQAKRGEISHTAPRNRDFPQNFRNTARLMFNNKNTHVTPANIRSKRNNLSKWWNHKYLGVLCDIESLRVEKLLEAL